MSSEEEKIMIILGWEYIRLEAKLWQWRKFHKDGHEIAKQGDEIWAEDMITARSET